MRVWLTYIHGMSSISVPCVGCHFILIAVKAKTRNGAAFSLFLKESLHSASIQVTLRVIVMFMCLG